MNTTNIMLFYMKKYKSRNSGRDGYTGFPSTRVYVFNNGICAPRHGWRFKKTDDKSVDDGGAVYDSALDFLES